MARAQVKSNNLPFFIIAVCLHALLFSLFFISVSRMQSPVYVTKQAIMKAALVEMLPPPPPPSAPKALASLPVQEQAVLTPPAKPKPALKPPTEIKPLPPKPVTPIKKVVVPPEPVKKEKVKKPEAAKVAPAPKAKNPNERKKLVDNLLQDELAQEQINLTKIKEQQAMGVINKYNSLILQAIRSNWLLPENYNADLSCQLLIELAPSGAVLHVTLAKSSGNEGFDRSARAAVYKASPLPVPQEKDIFTQMQTIQLTVRP